MNGIRARVTYIPSLLPIFKSPNFACSFHLTMQFCVRRKWTGGNVDMGEIVFYAGEMDREKFISEVGEMDVTRKVHMQI